MKKNFFAYGMLLLAGVLIGIGIMENQPAQVLAKAIRVCMECVGIG